MCITKQILKKLASFLFSHTNSDGTRAWLLITRDYCRELSWLEGKCLLLDCLILAFRGQTGDHIVFHCPAYHDQRRALLRGKSSWEEIDAPDWRKEGDDPPYDAIESFFDYLYHNIR